MSDLSGITAKLPAVLPPEVRKGGKEAKEAYGAALGFEQMLVKQLTKSMADSSAVGGGENGGAPPAYRDMISDQIATAITSAGGIGLAENLYKQVNGEDQA